MPMIYYKTFIVPMWVVVSDNTKYRTIMRYFDQKHARLQEWPSLGFKETLLSFGKKGWSHVIPEHSGDEPRPSFIVNPQLLMMAITEHIQKRFGPNTIVHFSYPTHRLNRQIESDADYDRIFNEILSLQSPTALSQMFQVAERCHQENAPRDLLWVTPAPCETKLLTRIANHVITIGEGQDYTINVTNIAARQISEHLETFFKQLMNKE
jgi:hypothetical protein